MTFDEVCKELKITKSSLMSNFRRLQRNLEKRGIIITKTGKGEKATYELIYPEVETNPYIIDLTGQKFGRLTVLKRATDHIQPNGKKVIQWECECECIDPNTHTHPIVTVRTCNLRSGHTQSCGCLVKERAQQVNIKNEVGKKYGHLTVLEKAECPKTTNSRHIYWKCQCDCELQSIVIVDGTKLRNGHTQSCGCISNSRGEEKISQILKENNIEFISEKIFPSLPQKRFDFFVKYSYLVEFDGIQHFQANGGWNTNERMQQTQQHDILKNQWCKDNNIPLIRIPYTHLSELCLKDLLLETTTYRVV